MAAVAAAAAIFPVDAGLPVVDAENPALVAFEAARLPVAAAAATGLLIVVSETWASSVAVLASAASPLLVASVMWPLLVAEVEEQFAVAVAGTEQLLAAGAAVASAFVLPKALLTVSLN